MAKDPQDASAGPRPRGGALHAGPKGAPCQASTTVHAERVAAERAVAQQIIDLVRSKPGAVLGVATGGTMVGVYRELASLAGGVDFTQVRAFSLDEFIGLAPSHPQSFRSFLEEHFLGPLELRPAQLSTPDAERAAQSQGAVARAYEEQIAAAGGIDLQLLGIGRNGHVAFNEPGSSASSRTRLITLDEVTRNDAALAFGSLDEVPTQAITVGIATIMEARKLRLLAFGSGKAAAIQRMRSGPIGDDVPATFLSQHSDLQLHIDRGAGSPS